MHYEGDIIRPPSEADSIILQVTTGCSHNRCTFCGVYREKKFSIKTDTIIDEDISFASTYCKRQNKVFLADGDALVMPQPRLVAILTKIKKSIPWVNKISLYANGKSIRKKSPEELAQLKELGLTRVYLGVESGDKEVLQDIDKGETPESLLEAGQKLKNAAIFYSVTILLGIADRQKSQQHCINTARLLQKMQPNQVAALTYMPLDNTPLGQSVKKGAFQLYSAEEILVELRTLLQELKNCKTQFYANHASNYLPLAGRLPGKRDTLIESIDSALAGKQSITPEHLRAL